MAATRFLSASLKSGASGPFSSFLSSTSDRRSATRSRERASACLTLRAERGTRQRLSRSPSPPPRSSDLHHLCVVRFERFTQCVSKRHFSDKAVGDGGKRGVFNQFNHSQQPVVHTDSNTPAIVYVVALRLQKRRIARNRELGAKALARGTDSVQLAGLWPRAQAGLPFPLHAAGQRAKQAQVCRAAPAE